MTGPVFVACDMGTTLIKAAVIDLDGHVRDERVADALLGLRRFSPRVTFLGSYPRADRAINRYPERYSDDVFVEARDWLRGLVSGEPGA